MKRFVFVLLLFVSGNNLFAQEVTIDCNSNIDLIQEAVLDYNFRTYFYDLCNDSGDMMLLNTVHFTINSDMAGLLKDKPEQPNFLRWIVVNDKACLVKSNALIMRYYDMYRKSKL